MMNFFNCTLCCDDFPVEFKNKHHKIPLSSGGVDEPENMEYLCVGCHQVLHAIARMLGNPKKAALVDDAIHFYYPSSDQQSHCRELAHLIVKYKNYQKEGLLDLTDKLMLVPIELPILYHTALRTLANEHRDPGSNRRKMGMAKYSTLLLMTHLEKEYPKLKYAKTLTELLEKPTPIPKDMEIQVL